MKMSKTVKKPPWLKYFKFPSMVNRFPSMVNKFPLNEKMKHLILGVYENEPMKELGYIMGDLLRSARLVVDTGLHQYGWSRENAIDYLVKNAAFSRLASEAEVDRYISLPGQAVSYKVGERKILELRKKFVEEDGENLKDFHAYLLQCEGPLSNVESCLDARFQKTF